jgi:hypothetical protein
VRTLIGPELAGKPNRACCVRLCCRMKCKMARLGFELRAQLDFERCKFRVEHSACLVALLFVEHRRLRRRSLSRNSRCYLRCAATPLSLLHKLLCALQARVCKCAFPNAAGFRTDESVAYALYRSDRISRSSAVRAVAIAVASSASSLHAPTAKGSLGSDRSAQLIGYSAHRCS